MLRSLRFTKNVKCHTHTQILFDYHVLFAVITDAKRGCCVNLATSHVLFPGYINTSGAYYHMALQD